MLKGTRGCLSGTIAGNPDQSLTLGWIQVTEGLTLPFRDAVPRRGRMGHVKRGSGVITNSGKWAWWAFFMATRTAWKPWRSTRCSMAGAAS